MSALLWHEYEPESSSITSNVYHAFGFILFSIRKFTIRKIIEGILPILNHLLFILVFWSDNILLVSVSMDIKFDVNHLLRVFQLISQRLITQNIDFLNGNMYDNRELLNATGNKIFYSIQGSKCVLTTLCVAWIITYQPRISYVK